MFLLCKRCWFELYLVHPCVYGTDRMPNSGHPRENENEKRVPLKNWYSRWLENKPLSGLKISEKPIADRRATRRKNCEAMRVEDALAGYTFRVPKAKSPLGMKWFCIEEKIQRKDQPNPCTVKLTGFLSSSEGYRGGWNQWKRWKRDGYVASF